MWLVEKDTTDIGVVMEKIINKINGFLPTFTGLGLLLCFLFYMVGYYFSKGLDVGYGITTSLASQQEIVANGLLLSIGLIDEIVFNAFIQMLSVWYFVLIGFAIAILLVAYDFFRKKKVEESVSLIVKRWADNFVVFLLFVYVFLSLPLASYQKAIAVAQDNINQITLNGCNKQPEMWSQCSRVSYKESDKTIVLEGLMLAKEAQEITVYLPKLKLLRTFQLPAGAVIERSYFTREDNGK